MHITGSTKIFSAPQRLALLTAFIGVVLIIIQIVLLLANGDGLCFNDGCQIVEQQTRIPPLVINIAGLLFFLLAAFLQGLSNTKKCLFSLLTRYLLLAGTAAEGVLFSFQHFVLTTYCSYCLIILGLILVLNLLNGLAHFFRAALVFSTILAVFSSLSFSNPASQPDLDQGTMAMLKAENKDQQVYLFFSSTCNHCAAILQAVQQRRDMNIHFNPIDRIEHLPVQGVEFTDRYFPETNRALLHTLGMKEVPVILIKDSSGFRTLKGETAISAFFADRHQPSSPPIGTSSAPGIPGLVPADDSCSAERGCEEPIPGIPGQ
ncbi:MAG: hypothetical protein CSA34_05315 [Desulfobulbus propionicus]|nr:MAG: hypothetical protein CSA34_05315 [Desulfobulbus propionicus]